MNIKHLAVCTGVALMVVACGDDDSDNKPAPQQASVNEQVAKQNAQQTIAAIATTTGSSENGASVGALSGAAQGSANILSYQPSSGAGTRSVAQGLNVELGNVHPLDIGDPGCTCSGTSCNFSNCSFGGTSGASSVTFTIDGSYSWGGGHVTCSNLKYTFKGDNLGAGSSGQSAGISTNTVVTLNCDITVTETSINGYVQSVGSNSTNLGQQAISSNWDVKSTYNNVTFDKTTHQATGGSLTVSGTVNATAGGQSYNAQGSGTVTFP